MSRRMFSRSLYVGTMTRARSGKAQPPSVREEPQPERDDRQQQRHPGDYPAGRQRRIAKRELDLPGSRGQRYADQVEVRPIYGGLPPIDGRPPAREVVLG